MSTDNGRYRTGYDVLGPVFAAFAQRLLLRARSDGVRRLAFVARDGEFLKTVVVTLIERLQLREPPILDYVYLSRVSTSLPQYTRLDDAALHEVLLIRTGSQDVATILRFFGLDAGDFRDELLRHGLHAGARIANAAAFRSFASDASVMQKIEAESRRQKGLLGDYLRQHELLSPGSALVDVGWRGSIPAALDRAFAPSPPLRCYYLGYWHELGCRPDADHLVEGLLADFRKGRGIIEGAVYYAAFLIEAICRSAEGTVIGYQRRDGGDVVPVLAEESEQREVERAGERWREPIRRGIVDYIHDHAEHYRGAAAVPRIRRDAQRRLFRLAFFPTDEQIAACSPLSHTEGHAESHWRTLVDPVRPSPLAFRRWLGGLSSPWRGGYIMATGGSALAWMYVASESLLLALPRLRNAIRKLALVLARTS